jgi:O-antigen/teichoic acid export membrane protein
MAIGVAWMALFKLASRGLGLISTVILARLLVPADFGLVAMAMSVIATFELMTAFNFEIVLIQKQSAERDHYNTAWTYNVVFGLIIAVVLVLISGLAAEFFREPRLDMVLIALAAGFAIESFGSIGIAKLLRELRFGMEFRLRMMQRLARFCVTVPLAFWLQSYWALVIGILVGKVVHLVASYAIAPHRPAFTFSASRELFGFSSWLLANNVFAFLRYRATELLLGRLAGTQELGVYTVSFEISNLPTSELVAPINRAVFPGYARMVDEPGKLKEGYLEVISLIALAAIPAGIGIAATAHLIVPVLLGDKWLAAIPVIQITAMYGALNALLTNSASVFNALGKPHLITLFLLITTSILLPLAYFFSSSLGAVGLAWAYVCTVPFTMVATVAMLIRLLEMRFGEFLANLWRPAVATVVMFAVITTAFPADEAIPASVPLQIGAMFAAIGLGAACYVAVVVALWLLSGKPAGAERIVCSRISEWSGKAGRRLRGPA